MRIGLIALCLMLASAALGAEAPEPDAEHLKKLEALGDNAWLNLKPKGMAYARMYSGCCFGGGRLWYFGGAHRGYKGNDVQLYNPEANVWVQATKPEWPTVGSKDWKLMTGGGGTTTELAPSGAPFTEHTYQQACWQPDRERFFVVLMSSGTWEFDPVERKWFHLVNRFEGEKGPRGHWAQNHTLYDPILEAPVLHCTSRSAGIYKFDHGQKKWVRWMDRPRELAWNEFYSTYVPDWKAHLISTMKKGFFRLDLADKKLTPLDTPKALTRCQSLAYDAANHVVIALASEKTSKYRQTAIPWAFDVKTKTWTELSPPKPWPVGQCAGNWAKLWYDREHNIHLFVNDVKRDRRQLFDGGITQTWAYRYKAREDKQEAEEE